MDRTLSAVDELRRQVGRLFAPSADASRARVGAEMELLVFDRSAADGHGVVPVYRLAAILATQPRLAAEARFSFEPGGQLELSPAPSASAPELVGTLRRLVAGTDALLARHGIGLASRPVDLWRTASDLGLQTPADRYLAMQHHFDLIGPAGRQMMRRTASLQVAIDLLPGEAGRRQWLLANLAAPGLAMAFGRPASEDGGESRLDIWRRVDPSRTGYDGAPVNGRRPATGYAAFALAATVMPLPRNDEAPAAIPEPRSRSTFRDWAGKRAARPDPSDVSHHLSTLFPPVRPRGNYLEIRFCDAQPLEWLDVPISVLAVLLGDERATQEALELVGRDTSGLSSRWAAAAGGADPRLQRVGVELFEIAARRGRIGAAVRLPQGPLALLDRYAGRYLRSAAGSHADPLVAAGASSLSSGAA